MRFDFCGGCSAFEQWLLIFAPPWGALEIKKENSTLLLLWGCGNTIWPEVPCYKGSDLSLCGVTFSLRPTYQEIRTERCGGALGRGFALTLCAFIVGMFWRCQILHRIHSQISILKLCDDVIGIQLHLFTCFIHPRRYFHIGFNSICHTVSRLLSRSCDRRQTEIKFWQCQKFRVTEELLRLMSTNEPKEMQHEMTYWTEPQKYVHDFNK